MTGRERLLKAVQRQIPDKVPVTLAYGHIDDLCRQRGHPEMVGKLRQDERTLGFHARPAAAEQFRPYIDNPPPGFEFDEWGIGSHRSSTGATATYIHPLANVNSPAEVHAYPFPDLTEPWRHENLEREIAAIHAQGLAAGGQMSQTIFELAMLMRGVERLLMDFLTNPDVATALLDRITEQRCFEARRLAEAGVDVLRVGDDIGSQRGLIMSPATWRRWLKPRMREVIRSGTTVRPDLPVKYHTDGKVEVVIAELAEIGVTILNPVQPEVMDPVWVKETYGDRLAFWGTIGCQSTLPFGTPDQVRSTVRHMIETVGAGGGLVLAPTHSIERDVPWENMLAFYDAAEEFGSYAR